MSHSVTMYTATTTVHAAATTGAAGSAAPSSSHHRPFVAAQQSRQQPSYIWNGSSWVAPEPERLNQKILPHATMVTLQQPQLQPQQQQSVALDAWPQKQQEQPQSAPAATPTAISTSTSSSSSSSAVEMYTRYYHDYIACVHAFAAQMKQLTTTAPADATRWQGYRDWAQYYADQSSRAAHVCFQKQQQQQQLVAATSSSSGQQQQHQQQDGIEFPPSPELSMIKEGLYVVPGLSARVAKPSQQQQPSTPAAPVATNSIIQPATISSVVAPAKHTIDKDNHNDDDDEAPDAVKEFVHCCMLSCQTDEDRAIMQQQIQNVMQQAFEQGTFHSMDWSQQPLLVLPGRPPTTTTATTATTTTTSTTGMKDPGARHPDEALEEQSVVSSSNGSHYQHDAHRKIQQHHSGNTRHRRPSEDGGSNMGNRYYSPASSHRIINNNNSVVPLNNRNNPQYQKPSRSNTSGSKDYYGPSSSLSSNQVQKQQLSTTGMAMGKNIKGQHKKKRDHVCNKNKSVVRDDSDLVDDDYIAVPFASSSSSLSLLSPSVVSEAIRKRKWERKPSTASSASSSVAASSSSLSGFDQSNEKLHRRAKRFAGSGGLVDGSMSSAAAATGRTNTTMMDKYMGKGCIQGNDNSKNSNNGRAGTIKALDEADYERMTVKGTCQTLDKEYLRLTAPPRPEWVRPESVLKQHLYNLKTERQQQQQQQQLQLHQDEEDAVVIATVQEGGAQQQQHPRRRRDYLWFCSQLKAVRQDCTVQRIQNRFTVDVYETHARMALEEGDLNEYNQCQTQLKELYQQLQNKDPVAIVNRNEFLAYRLLYQVVLLTGYGGKSGKNHSSADLYAIMASLTTGSKAGAAAAGSAKTQDDTALQHALKVRVAVADGDYHAFFQLRRSVPNHGCYLMDRIVPFMRHEALQRICKSYRPLVDALFVLQELGFMKRDDDDCMLSGKKKVKVDIEKVQNCNDGDDNLDQHHHGRAWLVSCGCVLSLDGMQIQTKDSIIRESGMEAQVSSLI